MKDKKNLYVLVEFPYPSGSGLHVGHAFSFTGADVYARFKRMQGYNVMFPMGWDAFGLPTENYAIKMKRKPQDVTKENTEMFKKQMKELRFSFDWNREINTTDPDYYKWTQWIFIKLFEKGLAYKKEVPINWCPSCKIGLANEEVVGNKCERCGAEVSRRTISQWIVKITEYADRLIDGLKDTDFIEKVKQAQINWIGKSAGANLKFKIQNLKTEVEVFTTRPDTLPSATFIVIAPEHQLVSELILQSSRASHDCGLKIDSETIKMYIEGARKKSDFERGEMNKEKTGVFTGLYAINPYNQKKMPIWISDFVLGNYGTGAIMSVPTQDERDKEFATKFGLEIIDNPNLTWEEGLKYGKETNSYHLRDWIFSRQHYWGEPIPMVNCPKCGWVSVAEKDLPIVLPEVDYYEPTETGESPLSKITDWVETNCPKCGGEAKRETDTMPNWAGSDWYYLRYLDPHNDSCLCDINKIKDWMPVDLYIGGDEHTLGLFISFCLILG
jgi:leucyl-tRNA synthetase